MKILSLFQRASRRDEWSDFVKSGEDQYSKKVLANVVEQFFIRDAIDKIKFFANVQVLKHHSRRLYKQYASFDQGADLSDYATSSIDALAEIGRRPLGYYQWFIAAYPDVVTWVQDLEDGEIERIVGNVQEVDLFDQHKKIKVELLRKIVDRFKEEGHALECVIVKQKKPARKLSNEQAPVHYWGTDSR